MPTWSDMRKKLEQDYLCPALRGRIQYFAASNSRCPDHEDVPPFVWTVRKC